MTELDPKLTFESFVVGPANRLASAAARRAAESPGSSYNPLFIYSASGLGKSHILAAVAHQARKHREDLKVLYQALEEYLEELADALGKGMRDAHRERYRELDILLLDDVQFLADQAEAQEMLLSTLDALTTAGSQIVLASDRPPADINGLDARLLSRFSGGLIVDIAAPEYETRVAIIRRKTEERGQELDAGVAEGLARYPFRNVRELGGALNRILAIQDLEERTVKAGEVARIMGDGGGAATSEGGDDFSSFLDEISTDLATLVDRSEEPWRKDLRECAETAEREGYSAGRLRKVEHLESEPEGWEELLASFRADLDRLRWIEEELDRLNNPWPELADDLIRDPDRLDEAESFLTSVQERQRPFRVLGPGPDLAGLGDDVPQLARKAAEQLVTSEHPRYNPLYFWSLDVTGPHALLAATARSFRAARPRARIAVTSVSDFAGDFIRSLSAGVAGAWRERWWTVDLLLVHDAQALSETERAQDEFFHLFEALKRRGSRVLITADRPPAGIEDVDERLRSRFEGGLVLEVEHVRIRSETADLTLYEPGALPVDVEPRVAQEAETVEVGAGAGGEGDREGEEDAVGLPGESAGVWPGRGRGWSPSGEKVVWHWPDLDDRLVETLE